VPEFVVRCRKTSTDPDKLLGGIGTGAHVEYLPHMIVSALFLSKAHRPNVKLSLIFEETSDYSRRLVLEGGTLGTVGGHDEKSLLMFLANALKEAGSLPKETSVTTASGVLIETISFEHFVKREAERSPVYVLDKKGPDIRELELAPDAIFVLTDHIPMPKKTFKSMLRQGVKKISLGPQMLHASQCMTLINNEYDRYYYRG
jgi:tRNA (pseudouridine54-N1)-methyltransferase